MSMTNEQLAVFIQQGDSDELIPVLWEKVRKLIYLKSEQFYRLHETACSRRGVELWDIKQVSYSAFLDAVKAFKADSGYKFTSFLKYPFRNTVNELLGLRSKAGRNEPLNNCASLDKPVSDEDEDCALIDLQEDEHSTDFIAKIESDNISDIIRSEVEALGEPYSKVIRLYYLEGKKLAEIGELLGVSGERVRQLRYKGERELRKSKVLRKLYNEHYQQRYRPRRPYYDWQPENYYLRYRYCFESK